MALSGARLYTVESMMNHGLQNIWTEAVFTCGAGKITKTLSQYGLSHARLEPSTSRLQV
jgi:hypothetical protein